MLSLGRLENVKDRTNLEFIDHSQVNSLIISKLSFKSIVNWYEKFSVNKFVKEKNTLQQTNLFRFDSFRTFKTNNV